LLGIPRRTLGNLFNERLYLRRIKLFSHQIRDIAVTQPFELESRQADVDLRRTNSTLNLCFDFQNARQLAHTRERSLEIPSLRVPLSTLRWQPSAVHA